MAQGNSQESTQPEMLPQGNTVSGHEPGKIQAQPTPTYFRALPIILVLVFITLLVAWPLATGVGVLPTLGIVLPALLVAWLLAAWLPGRTFNRGIKVLLAVLLSYVLFTLSTVIEFAAGGAAIHGIPVSIETLKFYGPGYFVFAYPLTIPLLLGADALLYFGGRALRLRRSLARVVAGSASVGLGMLLWIVSAAGELVLVAYMMEV